MTVIITASATAFFMICFLFVALTSKQETIEDKVKKLTAQREPLEEKQTAKNGIRPLIAKLGRLTPRKMTAKLDRELQQSGMQISGGEFFIFQGFLITLLFLISLAIAPKNPLALVLPFLGLLIPRLYLKRALATKIKRFENQLGDTLLILANSLKAGFSLLQAMDMASKEMPDPISSEFKITLKEMTYGESTETALIHLTERVGSKDLDLLVTAVIIQRQIGGNLAEVLLNIHDTIQERVRIQGEIKSLTAQGRLSGYLIAFLPFGVGLILSAIQPDYLKTLFESAIGMYLIIGGIISQLIGFLLIRKIVNIKV